MNKIRTTDDVEMRAAFNDLLAQYNQAAESPGAVAPDDAQITKTQFYLRHLWDTYFKDGVYASDIDVLRIISTMSSDYLPRDIADQCLIETAAQEQHADKVMLFNDRRKADSCHLLRHQSNVTSQAGEDGIIAKALEIMGANNQWCCEFGAWDGKKYSNTYQMVGKSNWHGVLIEGDGNRYQELVQNYRGNPKAHLFNQLVGFDPSTDSIDHILSQTEAPQDIDFMVIDIDGNDWHIWHTMTKYRPRLLVIEFNPTISNDVFYVQARNKNLQRGCSLNALIALGKAKNYELVCATTWNGFFVVKEEFEKFSIADNSIDAMYTPLMDGRIFQGMDSVVQTVDMPAFLWSTSDLGFDWQKSLPENLIVNR